VVLKTMTTMKVSLILTFDKIRHKQAANKGIYLACLACANSIHGPTETTNESILLGSFGRFGYVDNYNNHHAFLFLSLFFLLFLESRYYRTTNKQPKNITANYYFSHHSPNKKTHHNKNSTSLWKHFPENSQNLVAATIYTGKQTCFSKY
jgi:hypothetical protein